jgi:hypothetical protein
MFDSPAHRVTHREQVSSIYIRHYRGVLSHECRLALSPSIMSLKPSQQNRSSTVLAVAELPIYVAFAACSKFKLYFNGMLVVEANSQHPSWTLYGAYVRVSPGGVFSFSTGSCDDFKGFVGCFGSSVCTGYNDGNGWFCVRAQPPDGWMLPSYRHDDNKRWIPALPQGTISPSRAVEPGLDNNSLWLWPSNSQEEQMHCRWTL